MRLCLARGVGTSGSVHRAAGVRAALPFTAESYSPGWMDHVLFVRPHAGDEALRQGRSDVASRTKGLWTPVSANRS